jgi:hypothetical protein
MAAIFRTLIDYLPGESQHLCGPTEDTCDRSEGLPDPPNLGQISGDEANASSGRVTGRPSPGFLDRGSGEIHPDHLESVRG